ncbi:YqhG family protein [Psychrobacillus antarcticus]|uniref:YqhG family protein n=1 Tax=Psychrobacillus antarcticus TaxID=2879115 RepID=UPI0024078BEF|nr:YqhG family protein [Psychrobacillus antarcticus]
MYPQQVQHYLRTFFSENNCRFVNDTDHYLTVQLTIDMDKRIMNRPYYWQYVESTGGVPSPAQLTLITDQTKLKENIKGELVHFGSPRLSQLFQVTYEMGSFIQMFEQVVEENNRPILTPWLEVNYKVSYYSNHTKEMLHSLGLNLMNGKIITDFHASLSEVNISPIIPKNAFLLPYIIKPARGLERLDGVIENLIQQDDHSWADQAKKRWERDIRVLEFFYEGVEERPESYEMEKKALQQQYEARIKIEIINGGLFYLK